MLAQGNIRGWGLVGVTIDPASVAANTTAEQTFPVNGLLVGDFVVAGKPTATAGLGIVGARVSATNTLAITFSNSTAAPIDPAAEAYRIFWARPDVVTLPNVATT